MLYYIVNIWLVQSINSIDKQSTVCHVCPHGLIVYSWSTRDLKSQGRFSIDSSGYTNMKISAGLGGSKLDARGGIIGGCIELQQLDCEGMIHTAAHHCYTRESHWKLVFANDLVLICWLRRHLWCQTVSGPVYLLDIAYDCMFDCFLNVGRKLLTSEFVYETVLLIVMNIFSFCLTRLLFYIYRVTSH